MNRRFLTLLLTCGCPQMACQPVVSEDCIKACERAMDCGFLGAGARLGEDASDCARECAGGSEDGSTQLAVEACLRRQPEAGCWGQPVSQDYAPECRASLWCLDQHGLAGLIPPPERTFYAFASQDSYWSDSCASKYYCASSYCGANEASCDGEPELSTAAVSDLGAENCRSCVQSGQELAFNRSLNAYYCALPGVESVAYALRFPGDGDGSSDGPGRAEVELESFWCDDNRKIYQGGRIIETRAVVPAGFYLPVFKFRGRADLGGEAYTRDLCERFSEPVCYAPIGAPGGVDLCGDTGAGSPDSGHFVGLLEHLGFAQGEAFCVEMRQGGAIEVFPGVGIIPLPPVPFADPQKWRRCVADAEPAL